MCLDGDDGKLPVASSQRLLEEVIRKELSTEDFTINLSAGSIKGDNYIGIVFRVRAECRKTGKTINLIVKMPPQNEIRRKQFFARPTFEREILFYTEIYPMMKRFQHEKGIDMSVGSDDDDAFNQVPICYSASLIEPEEVIIMNDLKQAGFEMFDRHKEQSVEHFRLVMQALARFHALSFALKDQEPERLEEYKGMIEIFATRDDHENLDMWFHTLKERTLGALDEAAEPKLYARIKSALTGSMMATIIDLTRGESAEPYAVICHGDCWNNNILFKEESGKPVDVRLLDWQICRYASPVLDLMYFIFTASTKEFRDQHYTELLQLYHDTLSATLRRLGSDPEKLFPRSALDQQLAQFGRFGFVMAVMLLPIITTKSEDVPDLEEMAEKMDSGVDMTEEANKFRSESTEAVYNVRIRGVCQDMVQLGYL